MRAADAAAPAAYFHVDAEILMTDALLIKLELLGLLTVPFVPLAIARLIAIMHGKGQSKARGR